MQKEISSPRSLSERLCCRSSRLQARLFNNTPANHRIRLRSNPKTRSESSSGEIMKDKPQNSVSLDCEVKQGEIYMVDIPRFQTVNHEQYKRRPYVVMSTLRCNRIGNVIGVPLSHVTRKACEHRVLIPAGEIIPAGGCRFNFLNSVALTDHSRVLDVSRLEMPSIGQISRRALLSVLRGLAVL